MIVNVCIALYLHLKKTTFSPKENIRFALIFNVLINREWWGANVIQGIRHGCNENYSLHLLSRRFCVIQNAYAKIICILNRKITKPMKNAKVLFIFKAIKSILIYLIFSSSFEIMRWTNNRKGERKLNCFWFTNRFWWSLIADWMEEEKKIQIQLLKRSSILELCKNERICELWTANIFATRENRNWKY